MPRLARSAEPPDPVGLASQLATLVFQALKSDHPETLARAVAAAREALELRKKLFGDTHEKVWLRHNAASYLGGALVAQAKIAKDAASMHEGFRASEPHLIRSAEWMLANPDRVPANSPTRVPEAAQRVIDLYDDWHAAAPDAGHEEKAKAWRTRLAAFNASATSNGKP